ncbi:MAG: histidine phosphatase family protein [Myxococcota bacterium]
MSTAPLPPGVRLRVALMRHGQPEATAAGRCYGKLDVGLAKSGLAHVEACAEALRTHAAPSHIYASPRVRAVETAQVVRRGTAAELTIDERFAEIDFGEFEGQTYEEIERRHPEVYRQWMDTPTQVQFPGGESFSVMQARVVAGLEEIRRRHRDTAVAIVSHGGVGRIVVAHLLGMAETDLFRLEQSYANLTVFDFYDEMPVMRCLNWTPTPAFGQATKLPSTTA